MAYRAVGVASVLAVLLSAGAPVASGTLGAGYQLYVVRAAGGPPRTLSDGVHQDRSVDVARTGRVVFVREPRLTSLPSAGVGGIWTMNADGTGARRIVAAPYHAVAQPVWSPGGRRIAFIRGGPVTQSGLWVVEADGNGLRRLTAEAVAFGGSGLSWSPDGRWIAYQYADPAGCGFGEYTNCADWTVRLIAVQGGAARVLARHAAEPRFSPDGRRVAYLRTQGGSTFGVYVVRREARQPRAVWPKAAVTPAQWTPRGDRLLFNWRDGLYSIRADRRGLRRLGAPAFQLEWSPRGERIAYVRAPSGPAEIWVMRANGTGRRRVATTDGYHPAESVAWSRDGRWIFYTG